MIETIGTILAGLGFFFIGIHTISSSLKQITGNRFRMLFAKWTKRKWLTAFWGFISGAVTQSASGSTFIIGSMISSGLLSVPRAFPIISWANIGTSVLVFLSVINFKLAVFYLIGVAGTVLTFYKKQLRKKHAATFLYGVGLLFFGLQLLKQGAGPLSEMEMFQELIRFTRESYLFVLALGALLRFVAQSSSAVTVLAITMTKAGIFDVEQSIMIVYGTNLGSALTTYFLSHSLEGTSRQIAIYQVWLNALAALLFVPIFYLEHLTSIPLIKALSQSLSSGIESQIAYVFFINKLFTGLLIAPFDRPLYHLIARWWPPSTEEELSRTKYIHDDALSMPESAMDLLRMEQRRLVHRYPQYLDQVREEKHADKPVDAKSLFAASDAIGKDIGEFLNHLVTQDLAYDSVEQLIYIQNRQHTITSLNATLTDLVYHIDKASDNERLGAMVGNLAEGLDVILVTLSDTFKSPDEMGVTMLLNMTSAQGSLMEKMRKNFIANDDEISSEEKLTLYNVTTLFERVIWLIRSLTQSLQFEMENTASMQEVQAGGGIEAGS